MAKFGLSEAVAQFSQQTSITNNLWAVYVVATFTAAGFGASTGLPIAATIALTVGFWVFTLGHLSLVVQALRISNSLELDIIAALDRPTDGADYQFQSSIRKIAGTANPLWISITAHFVIDSCVTALIWFHMLIMSGD